MSQCKHILSTILLLGLLGSGCATEEEPSPNVTESDEISSAQADQTDRMNRQAMDEGRTEFNQGVAVIQPTEGNEVSGTITFMASQAGVRVEGNLSGLSEGEHGFHVHQYGDCSAGDGTSAGGHYNPTDTEHAGRTDDPRHMGDMGNISANAQGEATVSYVDSVLQLNGPDSILGRSVIVHAEQDDTASQPSGDAGARVGCGVIGIGNPNATAGE